MKEYRNDFPMLNEDYIYFNNASTTYKPQVVIDSINNYYSKFSVNTNRGIDSLGYKVTSMYENTRKIVADFIGSKENEIVFTRGTTESLNLVARTFGEQVLSKDDEIIVSIFEHHANFITWQELASKVGAKLVIVKTDDNGLVDLDDLKEKVNTKTKIVALNHTSNVFGGSNKLKEIAQIVHEKGAYFVVDGAQGIVHERINVKELDVDFYAFSGHKLYGPMGVGCLYGKYELLTSMPPLFYGGEMIDMVSVEKSTYKKPPYRFEAGTMMVPEVIGLGVAINYLLEIGYDKINYYIYNLREYLVSRLKNEIPGIVIYNYDIKNTNLITFNIKDIHAHDVASYLDSKKIIVRAGHHCAEPLMTHLCLTSTVRISLSFYNTKEECDYVVDTLKKVGDFINVIF